MSIKIDLLPGYISLQRWFKRWLAIALAALLLTAGILYILWYKGNEEMKVAQTEYEGLQANEDAANKAESARAAAESEAQPIESVVDFIVNAGKTGPERAALIDLTRRYIYSGAVVSSIDMSDGLNANLTYAVRDEQEYARSLLVLRRGSVDEGGVLFKGTPTASGVPGGPNARFIVTPPLPGDPATIIPYPLPITATGALKDPIVIPAEPGAAPAAGAGGAADAAPSGGGSGGSGGSGGPSAGGSGGSGGDQGSSGSGSSGGSSSGGP